MYVNVQTGSGFKGLIGYNFKGTENDTHRVVGGNLAGDAKLVTRQLVETAAQRQSIRKPVLHMVVAWHPDDEVDDATMEAVGDRLLDAMGVDRENHQHIYVRHNDTGHPHMHVVANRVAIDGTVYQDKNFPGRKARAEAEILEDEYGFTRATPLEQRTGGPIPEVPTIAAPGDARGGRQERSLNAMERHRVRSAKHIVHEAVTRALDKSDGTFESLDFEMRKDGVVSPSWSFNQEGEFNGASFTLMSATRPEEAEVGPHGGTFTFKGSQLGPRGGLSKANLGKALDRKAASARKREFGGMKQLYQASQSLRSLRRSMQGNLAFGANLGRHLSGRGRYGMAMDTGSVSRLLRLFDGRRLGRRQTGFKPTVKPTVRRR